MGDFYYAKLLIPDRFMNDEIRARIASHFKMNRFEEIDGKITLDSGLWMMEDPLARSGEFDLEHYLVEQGVPFDRWTENTGSSSPAYNRVFRPGLLDREFPESDEGTVVPVTKIQEIYDRGGALDIVEGIEDLLKEYNPKYPAIESYTDGGEANE
ncbi:hypothetical protein GZH47_33230 (plasmid) [Paenibacillus rhizovicinus]|uniref:Uncharacterized protein n=1 Tax=Paenibacillus rhizovicinus TaxID=2704463 RepID=A0A6C0PB65_9BACL|nr:hypothetical protein [Paenibacillus rhizovicinus]QHW35758.1 hypothetical protein GZH47_33230 [Paenibacillus rhizovicinus]